MASMALLEGVVFAALPARKHSESRDQALINQYNASGLRPTDRRAFDFLRHLKPVQALALMENEGRRNFGQTLQSNIYAASEGLLPLNGGSGANTNEYDLAHGLIPNSTQVALRDVGVRFSPVEPVAFTGGPFGLYCNPNDYSNHMPSDFKVTVRKGGPGHIMDIPLGTEQKPGTASTPEGIYTLLHTPPGQLLANYVPPPELAAVCSGPDMGTSRQIAVY